MSSVNFEGKVFKWLMDQKFYHGFLPREDLPYVLKKKGDFIFRVNERTLGNSKRRDIVISIAWPDVPVDIISVNDIKNILIERNYNAVWLDYTRSFHSLEALFQFYRSSDIANQNKERIKLIRPIGLFSWEFKHSQITLSKKVGQGAYGEVYKGKVKKVNKSFDAAIKAMRKDLDAGDEKMKEVMAEARLMRSLNHPNIVRCRGIAVFEQPVYIVIDFITGGGLDSFLKKNSKTLTMDQKNKMAISAAWGIEFMHSHDIIHRDIAARNCLYDQKNLVKLSDFGLARKGSVYRMKKAMKMPTRWLAPESLSSFIFSRASDVYTFGVLLYEIYTCQEPYVTVSAGEAKRLILSGTFPNLSKYAPPELTDIVRKHIYMLDPSKRATMKELVKKLEGWLEVELVLDEEEKPEDPAVKTDSRRKPTEAVSSSSPMVSASPIVVQNTSEKPKKKTQIVPDSKISGKQEIDSIQEQQATTETMSVANKMVSSAKRGSGEMLMVPPDDDGKPSPKDNDYENPK